MLEHVSRSTGPRSDCLPHYDEGVNEILLYLSIMHNDPEDRHHIVRLLDFFTCREHLFFVLELLNISLHDHYRSLELTGDRANHYNMARICAIAEQMLDALSFLHGINIVHCDVKAQNICIVSSEHSKYKLIDLGVALLNADARMSYAQSRYIRAPEVILGCEWGSKVDVWSTGCVLAELALGGPPFGYHSVELVLAAHKVMLGPFPQWMMTQAPLASKYFSVMHAIYEVDPPNNTGVFLIRGTPGSTINEIFGRHVNPTVFGDVDVFLTFLKTLLTIDPNLRSSAAEALASDFMAQYRA